MLKLVFNFSPRSSDFDSRLNVMIKVDEKAQIERRSNRFRLIKIS